MSDKPDKVNDLVKLNFIIPSYQRGYRWKTRQVQELLSDIEFAAINGKECCLGTLVVRPDGNKFRVIDGQQRLTTLSLLLEEIGGVNEKINICYEMSRKVDDFFKDRAKKVIKAWCHTNQNVSINFIKLKVSIIWFEWEEKDELKRFTDLNDAKIQLTNAELIKALLLDPVSFEENDSAIKRERELERAEEWDEIERLLQDDSFWYFAFPYAKDSSTRIDRLFEIIPTVTKFKFERSKRSNKEDAPDTILKGDNLETFLIISQTIKKSDSSVKAVATIWDEVSFAFATLKNWYEISDTEQDIYHRIGFLLAADRAPEEAEKVLINFLVEIGKTQKSNVIKELNQKIKEHFGKATSKNDLRSYLAKLVFKEKDKIHRALLLFNCVIAHQRSQRFPFDKYRCANWDIEHIRATNQDDLYKFENLNEAIKWTVNWCHNFPIPSDYDKKYDDASGNTILFNKHINMSMNLKTGEITNNTSSEKDNTLTRKNFIEDFQRAILKDQNQKNHFSDKKQDSLYNWTLLTDSVNRSIGKKFFCEKRLAIKAKDIGAEGEFIPIASWDVFNKAYSTQVTDINQWTEDDSDAYFNAIVESLGNYIELHEPEVNKLKKV